MGRLFGTDGIRGVANQYPMTAEMAIMIGRATVHLFKRSGHSPKIIVGKDTRISGYMLEYALAAGICSLGGEPIMVGVMPTPGIAYLTRSMRADAGIVLSASHNPREDNGIKIFSAEGFKLPDEKERAIEEFVLAGNGGQLQPAPGRLGKAYRMEDARGRYIVFLKHSFPKDLSLEGTKVILDCANGATYRVAPDTFFELGAEVASINDKPDGSNINMDCGSLHPRRLAEEVLKRGADAGFAFDGDGDRLIAVDEMGRVLTGDQILAISAKVMRDENRLTNNLVVRTVMSNLGLSQALEQMGIDSVMTQVGDRQVLEEMITRGAALGGEDSGHIIYLPFHTTGDGIITALQVMAAMKKEGKPLSVLAGIMEVFPQALVNIKVREKRPLTDIPAVNQAIEDVEAELGSRGRVLVRYSGTENLCRVMVEGPTREDTARYCELLARVIREELA
ncbi:MAG: phosphoglucosamine mutase [Smithellaceae bacterium]|nr:phosphoglucosamine mutase [Smithellaceae bacterium]